MGLLDNLLGSVESGQNASGGIGGMLLGLLASESGRTDSPAAQPANQSANQSAAALSGGLSELVQRLDQGGLGDAVRSWIGSGPNQQIAPEQLHQAIGPDTVDRLSQQTGISHSALLPLLAQALPLIVDRLTPNQRVPDRQGVEQMQSGRTVEV